MDSTASAHLPFLPLEVKGHILRFCDVETLAVSSRVSLAFLQLAGPILYEDITVRGKDQLEKLARSEDVVPSVAPFVSIAQTRLFRYIALESSNMSALDASRPISTIPIRLETVALDLRHLQTYEVDLHVLLAGFDAKHLRVISSSTAHGIFGAFIDLRSGFSWSRLQDITFINALASRPLYRETYFVDRSPFLDLIYDYSARIGADANVLETTLKDIQRDLGHRSHSEQRKAFGRVQIWVRDESEVELAKKMLVGCSCKSIEIGVKQSV